MGKVGYGNPPIEYRFSKTNPPPESRHKKHPNGYLTPLLKKVLLKQYRCQDPETQKIKKIIGAKGLMQVLIWEGMQGNVVAIKEILDRIDGKVEQKLKGEGFNNLEGTKIIIVRDANDKVSSDKETGRGVRIPDEQ